MAKANGWTITSLPTSRGLRPFTAQRLTFAVARAASGAAMAGSRTPAETSVSPQET